MTLDQETLDALLSIRVDGNKTTMPQLDRALYVKVNKALECLGGVWSRKAKAHVWDCDPGDPIADAVTTGEVRDWKKELQFFPTPPGLAARVVASARIENGHHVLEPSAGDGALIRAVREAVHRCELTAVEINPKMADALKLDNKCQQVFCAHFLTLESQPGRYDRIVMNPPFTKGQDIAHVRHAFSMLKPNGRLVAITSPGWTFRTDEAHRAFRALVEQCGESHEIPAGTFKEAGTTIRTMLVILNKPRGAEGQPEPASRPVEPPEASPAPKTAPKAAKATPRQRSARRDPAKSPVQWLKATPKARELREKLRRLAEGGINGERDAAKAKLARLEARVDFDAPILATADLFKGPFQGSTDAELVCRFDSQNWDVGNGIKAAIEKAAGIPCVWRNDELLAKATAASARKLAGICIKVSQAFVTLWTQFASAPGIHPADRGLFIAGLGDGMTDEVRTGAALPSRPVRPRCVGKAKARAVAAPRGLTCHPYSVATALGKQIRFSVPLATVAGELERAVKGELT